MFQFFGQIAAPSPIAQYGGGFCGGGLIILLTNVLRIFVILAGLYSLFNFVIAGFQYISSEDNPKNLTAALNKIIYTVIGLLVVASSFVLAAVLGLLIFGDPNAILKPVLFGPAIIGSC